MASPPVRICVTCVGGRLIYDIISALRAAPDFGAWILGVDADRNAHGRVLCDVFQPLPGAASDPRGWYEGLVSLLDRHRVQAVLILSDAESRALAPFRTALIDRGIRPSISSAETVAAVTDKLRLLEKLAAAGIDVGDFIPVDSRADLTRALVRLGYPGRKVVLKPRAASGSRGVLIIDAREAVFRPLLPDRFCGTGDTASVEGAMAAKGMDYQGLIAVSHYDGPFFDVDCIARNGKSLDLCARLRQLRNPLSPTSTGHKVVLQPAVLDYARAVAASLNIDGAGDFDIVLADNRRPIVLDAGTRFSGSVGGSLAAGANFPAQLVRMLLDLPITPLAPRNEVAIRPFITMAPVPAVNADEIL
jgi:hypothetical protein